LRNELFLAQALAGHLCFHDNLLGLEQEIHPARVSAVRWRPFLRPNIREVKF
jgi:hypothetical protein